MLIRLQLCESCSKLCREPKEIHAETERLREGATRVARPGRELSGARETAPIIDRPLLLREGVMRPVPRAVVTPPRDGLKEATPLTPRLADDVGRDRSVLVEVEWVRLDDGRHKGLTRLVGAAPMWLIEDVERDENRYGLIRVAEGNIEIDRPIDAVPRECP